MPALDHTEKAKEGGSHRGSAALFQNPPLFHPSNSKSAKKSTSHRLGLAELSDTGDLVDIFVAGVGTGHHDRVAKRSSTKTLGPHCRSRAIASQSVGKRQVSRFRELRRFVHDFEYKTIGNHRIRC